MNDILTVCLAEFNNGWLFPSSGEWEVNSGLWEVGGISGKLWFALFAVATPLQWVTTV